MDKGQHMGMTNLQPTGLPGSKMLVLSGSAGLKKVILYKRQTCPCGGLDFAAFGYKNGAM
jgi:hypothetical protein